MDLWEIKMGGVGGCGFMALFQQTKNEERH